MHSQRIIDVEDGEDVTLIVMEVLSVDVLEGEMERSA